MTYVKQTWVNCPDGSTPIHALQLQHMEDGIAAIDAKLAANAPPSWVQPTLQETLDALAHPVQITVLYQDGWAVDTDLQSDPHFGWFFVGGSEATPPPVTVGPQVWDRAYLAPDWVCFDLSTATPFLSKAAQNWVPLNTPMAVYSGGQIHNNPDWGSTATFSMPGFVLDPGKVYQFRAQYGSVGYLFGIMQQNPSWAVFNDNYELGATFPTASEMILTVGPGQDAWNAAITAGYQTLIRFDVSDGLTSLCYKEAGIQYTIAEPINL